LKRRGPSTIAHLSDELRLTGEGIRQQLLQLQREGWVEAKIARDPERIKTGRPATSYSLTEAGDHLFPKEYDALSVAVIDAVADELGPDAIMRVLRRIYEDRVAVSEGALRDMTLEQKVEALKGLYIEHDPFMEVEKVEDGFRLVERNCPFLSVAMRRPALCSVTVSTLQQLLGVKVVREQRFQHGDGCCAFRICFEQPLAAATGFQLEEESAPAAS